MKNIYIKYKVDKFKFNLFVVLVLLLFFGMVSCCA